MGRCFELPDLTTLDDSADIFRCIGVILTSSLQPGEVVQRVMKIVGDFFSPHYWSLLLMDKETGKMRFEVAMGVDADRLKGVQLEKGEGIVGWVCRNNTPVVVENAAEDKRFSPRIDGIVGFSTRSIVCVPLVDGRNQVVGAIELINKIVPPSAKTSSGAHAEEILPSCKTFTQTDMKILSSIGSFTGIAIENARLHQKVQEMALTDSLTGINNRCCFNEKLTQEIGRVRRYGNTACMLMMDVDDFKTINDTFGHVTGDRVLRSIADILAQCVRESDMLARFGGDEFVVLMPHAKEADGLRLAGRIQERIDDWNSRESTDGVKLGMSIGVYEAGPESIDRILLEADRQLYRCKRERKKTKR